ncbi:hypothetical protein [Thiocapsa marina]|uniref:hypothetical protein n=1 Tax=Thiocapsa marina TaxID=244573 RepID=UPI0011119864|nr:hypothetical protein [Thiocapsa marina]
MFIKGQGSWSAYQSLPGVVVVDFHHDYREPRELGPPIPYYEKMANVSERTIDALQKAINNPSTRYVLFTHGSSTSRLGKTTARSQVRKIMRSKTATPFICRKQCIQHETVFLASIKGRNL